MVRVLFRGCSLCTAARELAACSCVAREPTAFGPTEAEPTAAVTRGSGANSRQLFGGTSKLRSRSGGASSPQLLSGRSLMHAHTQKGGGGVSAIMCFEQAARLRLASSVPAGDAFGHRRLDSIECQGPGGAGGKGAVFTTVTVTML